MTVQASSRVKTSTPEGARSIPLTAKNTSQPSSASKDVSNKNTSEARDIVNSLNSSEKASR